MINRPSFRVLICFIRKEYRQILRTREMLILMFGVPFIQLLILGFAVTNEVKNVKLYIQDMDNTQLSKRLSESFTHTDRFVVQNDRQGQNPIALIDNWKVQIAVIIPPGFAKDLQMQRQPCLRIVSDGLDGNTAALAVSYASGILTSFLEETQKAKQGMPQSPQLLAQQPRRIKVEERMWYNQDLNSSQYMIPGIIVILITVISMMMSSMSLVKEKEIGTLEQLLVSPVQKSELLMGKLIPYWLISMFEISFVTLAAHFIFGIHVAGSPFVMGTMAAIYLISTLGLGILISTLCNTQQQAMFYSWFFMVFMILLSGLFVPIQNMPPLIRKLTMLNPMTHFLGLTRDIMIKGTGMQYLLEEGSALLLYGLGLISISIRMFHKTAG